MPWGMNSAPETSWSKYVLSIVYRLLRFHTVRSARYGRTPQRPDCYAIHCDAAGVIAKPCAAN
jgi:hypothetical protein